MKIINVLCVSLFLFVGNFVNVNGFSANSFKSTLKSLKLTPNQQTFYDYLRDDEAPVVICHGLSGTGKTTIGILHALDELKKKRKDKIILTRPTVLVDSDNFGALPGNINDKMSPLLKHVMNIIGDEPNNSSNLYNIVKENKIEIIPLEYIRGHNFKNSLLICDESQNASNRQMKALLTRIGIGTKLIVLGDCGQSDLEGENGLADFIDKYDNYKSHTTSNFVKKIEFTEEDIKRSDIVKEILRIYK